MFKTKDVLTRVFFTVFLDLIVSIFVIVLRWFGNVSLSFFEKGNYSNSLINETSCQHDEQIFVISYR